MEKYKEGQRERHCVVVDLENLGQMCLGLTEEFKMEVSPFLFALVMDSLTDNVRWTMMFAGAIA